MLAIVELPPLLSLVTLVVVFELLSDGPYLTVRQLEAIATLTAAVAIPAVGVTLLIISGEFDLSVGAVFAFRRSCPELSSLKNNGIYGRPSASRCFSALFSE